MSKLPLREILADRWLRLTNLYYTKTKKGVKTLFKPWPEQAELLSEMHYLNVILKARQRGITTAIQIFMLDACLFNRDVSAGVIAHNQKDAQAFFRDKIKFAYDSLPEALRQSIRATNDNAGELVFSNGSSIRVGTSMRSGTLQYLHVSEHGKICAKYPEKAEEIRSGSLNTVAPGCFIFIESTAEGAWGHFYDLCRRAEKLQVEGAKLTDMDYKFFFFPWFRAPEYRLEGPAIAPPEDIKRHFEDLGGKGVTLDTAQKNWYIKKKEEQGDLKMTQEFPSTPEDAFRGIVEGAIFGKQLREARAEGRISDIPVAQSHPVHTFWDIGRDTTAIWFMQQVGPQCRFIDYYQESHQELPHFIHLLRHHPDFAAYSLGTFYFPHDMDNVDWLGAGGLGKTRLQVAITLGLTPAVTVPRVKNLEDGLEIARQALKTCYFDRGRCEAGIKGLENYRFEFNAKLETYMTKPLHNWASHPADAFRQFAQGYTHRAGGGNITRDSPLSRASRARDRRPRRGLRV